MTSKTTGTTWLGHRGASWLTELYVARGLSPGLARQVAVELTAHDALAAHAEAEAGAPLPAGHLPR